MSCVMMATIICASPGTHLIDSALCSHPGIVLRGALIAHLPRGGNLGGSYARCATGAVALLLHHTGSCIEPIGVRTVRKG